MTEGLFSEPPDDDEPETIAKYDSEIHTEPPEVRYVSSSDSAASGDEISKL
jgi:hypothetical protein